MADVDDAGGGRRGLKPTLSSDIAQAVADTWGCDVQGAAPLGGSTGLNLLAAIDGRLLVVRVHRAHVTAARVEALQLAREAAARAGVPTAIGIRGRRGERCITVGSSVIEVEAFIASEKKMDSLARIRAAMPMLARLHDGLESADLPDAARDVSFANYVSARDMESRTAAGAQRIRTLGAELHAMANAAEQLAQGLTAKQSAVDALPVQWCHGDFWDDNVLFRDHEIVLVADFGFMGRRPRIDDLALTLYFTLWDLIAARHEDPLSRLVELVASYDTGTSRPLSREERDVLPLVLARQPLWSVAVWAAELDDDDAVATHLRGQDTALMIGREILDSVDRWRDALRS